MGLAITALALAQPLAGAQTPPSAAPGAAPSAPFTTGKAASGEAKAALSHQLYVAGERFKANAKFLLRTVPARCAALRRAQETFQATLQKNMIVLATTHAVAEGIVRRLSGDLARKSAPQVYGATGRAAAPHPRHGQPLAVSRTL